MHSVDATYDVAIIGGGLAGLGLSIQLVRMGFSVCVVEKEKYPFHKVCGEYVSMESWDFLVRLGLPLPAMKLPMLDTFVLTSLRGRAFTTRLPLGGFGISRYTLDQALAHIAKESGVVVLEETKAEEVAVGDDRRISVTSKQAPYKMVIGARVCCGAFGKRSNLDVKWKRDFLQQQDKKLDNYVGVKYHVRTDWKDNVIGLHNFADGYCGISKVEGERYCLCYMTKAQALKRCNNDIRQLEQEVLSQNPFLKGLFATSAREEGFPVAISQISFNRKTQVEQGVLLLGDAAGMITPLCGNGMSMALHGSKIAAWWIGAFLRGEVSRQEMEQGYEQQWQRLFGRRLKAGRLLQQFFGKEAATNLFVETFRALPFLAKPVVRLTHGAPF